jgi:hypothetical protein
MEDEPDMQADRPGLEAEGSGSDGDDERECAFISFIQNNILSGLRLPIDTEPTFAHVRVKVCWILHHVNVHIRTHTQIQARRRAEGFCSDTKKSGRACARGRCVGVCWALSCVASSQRVR